jgi:hypothetical protein
VPLDEKCLVDACEVMTLARRCGSRWILPLPLAYVLNTNTIFHQHEQSHRVERRGRCDAGKYCLQTVLLIGYRKLNAP